MAVKKPVGEVSPFDLLCEVIADILGADVAEILDIQPSSKFVIDLGMDSIKIVALVEQGIYLYDGKVDFANWLTQRSFLESLELTVGDVAEFIEESLKAQDTAE